ncbi:MAG: hypothetical protein FJZ16_07445 [Candidatus Omnitrophica bacterium]|nr:hypothetical protein [Candidatus Omnitrophota bacterium]
MMFLGRTKAGFSTYVWWTCASIYLIFSFFCDRFWYTSNVLFFIFTASYLNDWIGKREWRDVLPGINKIFFTYSVIIILFLPHSINALARSMNIYTRLNTHYENVACWMRRCIPEGETVYHAYATDSSYFICLNPKNSYLVSCDPVYMFYRYPMEFRIYEDLRKGNINNPHRVLREVFKVNYGYTRNDNALYGQIKRDASYFKILYEDEIGIVFEILKNVKG